MSLKIMAHLFVVSRTNHLFVGNAHHLLSEKVVMYKGLSKIGFSTETLFQRIL